MTDRVTDRVTDRLPCAIWRHEQTSRARDAQQCTTLAGRRHPDHDRCAPPVLTSGGISDRSAFTAEGLVARTELISGEISNGTI